MDYESIKKQILTDYVKDPKRFNKLKRKLRTIRYRYHIKTNNFQFEEEFLSEILLALAKYNAEKLVKVVQANPNNLEAIAYTIGKRYFRVKKENPNSPNNSPGTKMVFASTFSNPDTIINPLEQPDEEGIIPYDDDIYGERNYDTTQWDLIKERLTDREIDFLELLMSGAKDCQSMTRKEFNQYKRYVFDKVQTMDLSKALTPLEVIYTKLDKEDLEKFHIIYDEDLSVKQKIKKLKVRSKWGYFYQRKRIQKIVAKIRGAKDDNKTSD